MLPAAVSSSAVTADSLLVVLWRSRGVMLLCLLAAVAGGAAYIQIAPPIYTSTAKLYLDYAGIRLSNPYDPGSRPQTDKYLSTQAELIKSRPILASAPDSLKYRRLRTFAATDVPATYLHKNMAVEIGKKDEVISLALRSPYADEAAEIVNRVVDAYMEYRSEHEQRSSAQVLKVYQDQLLQRGDGTGREAAALGQVQARPHAVGPGIGAGRRHDEAVLRFQSALTQARLKTMEANGLSRRRADVGAEPRRAATVHPNAREPSARTCWPISRNRCWKPRPST